jgi:PTS system N-acetylglucosamine-specific IIC component
MSATNVTATNSSSSASGRERLLGGLQTLARAFMLPIAVLPVAALLLRLGQPDLLDVPVMAAAGNAIFSNLAALFAIGIAVGLTGGEGAAGLAGLVGYFVFAEVFNAVAPPELAGEDVDPIVSMGVFSGIIVGLTAAGLYRRFHDVRLPDYLGFFGGRRFVPIVTAVAALVLGVVFGFLWPPIQLALGALGAGIVGLGAFGPFLYGLLNRLLIPVGLVHVLNTYIWFQLGSFEGPDGVVNGEITRYFAGDPTAGEFLSGYFPIMMFGLPAACLAMVRHARQTKVAAGILLSAGLTSFLTGITEPVEFAFLFAAPLLFLVHAVLTGTSLFICALLDIKLGFGFSAGAIDYLLNFRAENTTGAGLLLLVGLAYGAVYYLVFSFFIQRFDLATPGRGQAGGAGASSDWILPESQRGPRASETNGEQLAREAEREASGKAAPTATIGRDRDDILAEQVLEALGGRENVESVEGCITRLRLFLGDPDRLDEARLKELGASGVAKRGRVAQVVMGTQSDRIAARMNRIIKEGI